MYNSPCGKVGKVARASAAARGVSFIFGRFFGQKLEYPSFVAFVKKTMFRTVFFLVLCLVFW